MIWVYRLLFWPIFLCVLPYYLLKMLRRGGYGAYWWHRFGLVPTVPKTQSSVVWIQAVSVGEIESLEPLLLALRQRNLFIYLTTTTSTGLKIAQKKYGKLANQIAYFPLDFFTPLAWHRIHPQLVLLVESELWPELLQSAYKKHVCVLLINGRCSDRSWSRYRRIPPLIRVLLKRLTYILAASELDRQRYCELGMPQDRVFNVGNLKVDAAKTKFLSPKAITRKQLQWNRDLILLGASTWPGEEELLINVYLKAKTFCPNLKLLLVPRHVERAKEIVQLIKGHLLTCALWTQFNPSIGICIVNTTGDLNQFVALSDLIFIGKSLPPNAGGQTPIEAAVAGKAIIYGPNMQNFQSICQSLEQFHGALRCSSHQEVYARLLQWIQFPHLAQEFKQGAQYWVQTYANVTERIMPYIEQALQSN